MNYIVDQLDPPQTFTGSEIARPKARLYINWRHVSWPAQRKLVQICLTRLLQSISETVSGEVPYWSLQTRKVTTKYRQLEGA